MQTQNLTFNEVPATIGTLLNEVRELKQNLNLFLSQSQDQTPEQDELITIKEACQLLNVSRATLFRYEKQGKVKVYGIGARRLIKKAELIESLTEKK